MKLKNSYLLMRHGQSEANVKGLIISKPETGCHRYGLSMIGQQQVRDSVRSLSADQQPTVVITSDFLRTRETANLVTEYFNLNAPIPDIRLRERWFGEWEGSSDQNYQTVWQGDDPLSTTPSDVEPAKAVRKRGLVLLDALEQRYQDETILLVSHGDMLQILRTAFSSLAANQHRQLPYHQTAEVKLLALKGTPFLGR